MKKKNQMTTDWSNYLAGKTVSVSITGNYVFVVGCNGRVNQLNKSSLWFKFWTYSLKSFRRWPEGSIKLTLAQTKLYCDRCPRWKIFTLKYPVIKFGSTKILRRLTFRLLHDTWKTSKIISSDNYSTLCVYFMHFNIRISVSTEKTYKCFMSRFTYRDKIIR